MSKSTTFRLGGVPEHFNLPIHLAVERGDFSQKNIDLQWTTYSGGTGQMTRALRDGEIDACILLTEGIIKDIIQGSPTRIISGYINTPLIWGVHTGQKNPLRYHEEIYDRKYAISRFGSGSHLMAIVDATVNDRSLSEEQFVIVKDLDGALKSLSSLESDVFYWEKYTTKPYVDNGPLRRIGEFITPWPCFVIAARNEYLGREPDITREVLQIIHHSCWMFMDSDDAIPLVAQRYEQEKKDVERWFHSTEWATHGWVSNKMLRSVMENLKIAGIVEDAIDPANLVWGKSV